MRKVHWLYAIKFKSLVLREHRCLKKSFAIGLIVFAWSFLMVGETYAQLITDSDRKLKSQDQKTQRSNSKAAKKPSESPFKSFKNYGLFSKKLSASSDRDFGSARVAPKYSAGSPFRRDKYTTKTPRYTKSDPYTYVLNMSPKYSKHQVWSKKDLAVGPRYSDTKTFRSSSIQMMPRYSRHQVWSKGDIAVSPRYSVKKEAKRPLFEKTPRYSKSDPYTYVLNMSPRYSKHQVWSKDDLTKSPRYSIQNIWSKDDVYVSPRYSVGRPFQGEKYSPAPRYSTHQVWSKDDLTKSPRYSIQNIWSKDDVYVSPRYSIGRPFQGEKYSPAPRYSLDQIWSKDDLVKTPRYSVGNPYEGYKYLNIPPRYSENKHRFDINKRATKENAIIEYETPFYTGNYKVRWKNNADMHPSFNHHKATSSMKIVRESMREWNIFWVNINGNKEDSEGVKQKVPKPKFDRKEAEIWND